jgi:hypothetical protein
MVIVVVAISEIVNRVVVVFVVTMVVGTFVEYELVTGPRTEE